MTAVMSAAPPVVKPADGFFTTFFVSPISVRVARVLGGTAVRPDQVTWFALALGVVGAGLFATGERWGFVAGGALAYFAFFFDCVDGQLARLTERTTQRGAYLDLMLDRVKEYALIGGLALGAAPDAWILACAALALQATRHAVVFARRLEMTTERASGLTWLKRIATFPIGERFAVMALVTAIFDPEITLWVLLAGGSLGFAYVIAGKLRRPDLRPWAVPAAQRAVELGGLTCIAALGGFAEAAYPVIFVLAMVRYHQVLR